jgi:GNAT-family acetyltransferase (TIGR03103 family)
VTAPSATRPGATQPGAEKHREQTGPGGDPVLQGAADAGPISVERKGVVVDCGWGRLVFGQTFPSGDDAAEVLRAEAPGSRDICLYLPDPHVLVARRYGELFLDPSYTYRLDLTRPLPDRTGRLAPPKGLTIRPLRSAQDAETVNSIYARNRMVTSPVETIVANAATPVFEHLVAEGSDGTIVGTITGVDHVEAFGDPEGGTSLWCLTVDNQYAPPGTGMALTLDLAERFADRGRRRLDLSVLADNAGAIRLYEKLGFVRVPEFCVKRKNSINEPLFAPSPAGYEALNPYARIVADEARRRGIDVEVLDAEWGELRLTHGGRSIVTRESLSELTTAVAMSRCDDKRITRRLLERAGLTVPAGRLADGGDGDRAFLAEHGSVVVKPARGEQGHGITVGITDPEDLEPAVAAARRFSDDVLLEQFFDGEDLRVIVIDFEVVAAALRRPAEIIGDGEADIRTLVERQSHRRAAATGGESRIPLDEATEATIRAQGRSWDDVLPAGEHLRVRRTANLHTGGTIHDVTPQLHPTLAEACVRAARALDIPVTGLDLMVLAPDRPDHVFVEANERPGLANHEPQPTAEKFVDLLFPATRAVPRGWRAAGVPADRTS